MTQQRHSETRRPYSAPRVSIHGDVKQVTHAVGNKSKNSDNAAMGVSKTQ